MRSFSLKLFFYFIFLAILLLHYAEPRLYAQTAIAPTVETVSFSGSGDIADDSAIWLNPSNPAQSVVIGDNKDDAAGGLAVFGLDGKIIQFRQDGYIGNVDLRNNFSFGGQSITIVGANHRGNNTIVLYKFNPSTRQLEPISGTRPTSTKNYGFCFYKSKQSGKLYAIVPHESGLTEQYELVVSGTSINTTKVRSLTNIGTQAESCVADDELGHLYVGEEDVAIWKYNAEPSGGLTRTQVDTSANGGNVTNDIEGMSLAYGPNGTGYLFVSRQSNSTYALYRREGSNAFVKTFTVGASGTIDAVSGTDGLDVLNANLGSAFPKGLLVVHDTSNSGGTTSNLKFVPLQLIVDMTTSQPPTPTVLIDAATSTSTSVGVTVFLHGIGKSGDNSNVNSSGNMTPNTTQRTITLEFLNTANVVVQTSTGTITYNTTNGNFTGLINGGALTTGLYTVRAKTDKYLRRQVPGIISITAGNATTIAPFTLVVGDVNNDNRIDISDYNMLLGCFSDLTPAKNCDPTKKFATDITDDGNVNQFDYNLFLREISVQGGNIDPTPAITAKLSLGPTIPNPGITGTPGTSAGVWISKTEIMKLPMSGSAWTNLKNAADSSWGSACLYDNNCMHDVNTLAGALVAVRTGDAAMLTKTQNGLKAAMGSSLSRALELSRGLQTYIIAADIIGYHDSAFEAWVRKMLTTNVQGHSGGVGVLGTATNSSNNWGGHARACVAAAAVYLNDASLKQTIVTAHKAFIGTGTSSLMVYTGTNWMADSRNPAGENRKGAVISGKNVSGALPEDWRRAGEFKWPPAISGYMWEGIQGYVVTAVILHRAGLVPFSAGDNAVVRAMDAMYGTGEAATNSPVFRNPASGDDTWIPWVVNYYGGKSYPTTVAAPGKNMAWTDWTHAK